MKPRSPCCGPWSPSWARRETARRRLFLKLDCWHSRDLPLFRRAFPDTPWVFLYREPVEVMVSQTRRRGVQMSPSLVPPATFGLDLPDGVPNDDYCARVLAAVCEAAAQHYPARRTAGWSNYRELPEALFTRSCRTSADRPRSRGAVMRRRDGARRQGARTGLRAGRGGQATGGDAGDAGDLRAAPGGGVSTLEGLRGRQSKPLALSSRTSA
jgi:hypothetical protein